MSGYTWPKALGPEPGPAKLYVHPVPKAKRGASKPAAAEDTTEAPPEPGTSGE